MIKVHVLDDCGGAYDDYVRMFKEQEGFEITNFLEEADLLCFTGGTDINPDIYGEQPHYATDIPDHKRDVFEESVFNASMLYGVPMVGICRGSQLLYALNGGKLNQHIPNHTGPHRAKLRLSKDSPWEEMTVTSSHHQQMKYDPDLEGVEYLGLATCYHKNEVEVAHFPRTKCLCHQPHPEWMDADAPYRNYFFETLKLILED